MEMNIYSYDVIHNLWNALSGTIYDVEAYFKTGANLSSPGLKKRERNLWGNFIVKKKSN